ncbi:hypothetical protein [Mycobacterium sp. DL440]|nr:hypothetical protein [Mycobacterium sp. DL440]
MPTDAVAARVSAALAAIPERYVSALDKAAPAMRALTDQVGAAPW